MGLGDKGRELALTIAASNLVDVARTVERVRQTLDLDEPPASFTVEHHQQCPAYLDGLAGLSKGEPCACGLTQMIDDLRACAQVLTDVQAQLKRLAETESSASSASAMDRPNSGASTSIGAPGLDSKHTAYAGPLKCDRCDYVDASTAWRSKYGLRLCDECNEALAAADAGTVARSDANESDWGRR